MFGVALTELLATLQACELHKEMAVIIMDEQQKAIENYAAEMLEKCESIQLASITETGYPRICEMEKVMTDGFGVIYFTTLKNSQKVKHFNKNVRAGVSFCMDSDSVSLIGKVDVINDMETKRKIWQGEHERRFVNDEAGNPKYCILRFTSLEATFLVDGEKVVYRPLLSTCGKRQEKVK